MFAKKKYLKKIIIKSAFLRARSVEIIGQFRNMLSFPKFVRFYLYRSTGIFNLLVCYITITYCKLLRHETNINQTYSKKNFVKTANESQILQTKKKMDMSDFENKNLWAEENPMKLLKIF